MTIWYVDVMWGVALFAVAFFTAGCVVFNPALRSIRTMGIIAAYGLGLWMVVDLPLVVALATWCVFASLGGLAVLLYELWARHRYAGTGRTPRPFVLVQGFLLWPGMIPDAIEGVLIDLGVLDPSGPNSSRD